MSNDLERIPGIMAWSGKNQIETTGEGKRTVLQIPKIGSAILQMVPCKIGV